MGGNKKYQGGRFEKKKVLKFALIMFKINDASKYKFG